MQVVIAQLALTLLANSVFGTDQGGCADTTIWELFADLHSDGATATAAGYASEFDCFALCVDDSACYAFEWYPTESSGDYCWIHATADTKLGDVTGISHYRKQTVTACPSSYYYKTDTCQVYMHKFYRGMFPYDTQTVSTADPGLCLTQCLADSLNCVAFDYHPSNTADNCNLYNTTWAFEIMAVGESADTYYGTDFYFFAECGGLRDAATQGFHLHAEYMEASAGTTTTGGTYNECWDTCFGDVACEGFGWIDSSTSCITYDSTTINTTVATSGTFHHVLFSSPDYTGSGDPPAVAYTDPDTANCFQIDEVKLDTRSFSAGRLSAGHLSIEACAEACRDAGTSVCATFEWNDAYKPFKGFRCFAYTATPSVTFTQTDKHEYLVSSSDPTTCPTSSASVSADSCTWLQYDSTSGLYLTGVEDSTATTVADCYTACVTAGYGCGAIDFSTSNVCTLYEADAAYFYTSDTTVTHYVRTACT